MALKKWADLVKVDVNKFVSKRDGADYLPWAKCVELLHQNGAEKVFFEPLTNEQGSSLFMSDKVWIDGNENTNSCYEIAVKITIDDDVFVMREPLMNGKNPVKDNSLTQQRVGNAQKRAFVKGVALRTGLGFGLWSGDVEDIQQESDDLSKHSLKAIKERLLEKRTAILKKGFTDDDIAKENNMSIEEMRAIFSYFNSLARYEQHLNKMLSGADKK